MTKPSFLSPGYLLLYLPYIAAWGFSLSPTLSYLIAWLGSFYIFYITLTGRIEPLPEDLPVLQQLLRPLFIVQIIFAGYMASSSIFFFLQAEGYRYLEYLGNSNSNEGLLELTASCQRDYLLGHAALMHGILYTMKYPVLSTYKFTVPDNERFFLVLSIVCLGLGFVFRYIPGLDQFQFQMAALGFVSATFAFAESIPKRKFINILFSGGLYGIGLADALASGFKEQILVSVLILGLFLIPVYGRKILYITIPVLVGMLYVLPTFVNVIRSKAWFGDTDISSAQSEAVSAVLSANSENLEETNWGFLTGRLSEIGLFVKYKASVPDQVPYYGFQIVEQAITSIVPRVFWPGKPITEDLVMERVFAAGVVNRASIVSAKPQFVVDGFLSGGIIGIWLSLFLYGVAAQWIAVKAEMLFGGYELGTAVIYTGLFQSFWRGLCFEFMFTKIFWSFALMYVFFYVFRNLGVLEEKS